MFSKYMELNQKLTKNQKQKDSWNFPQNIWKINSMILNNQLVKEEVSRKILNSLN